MKDVEALCLFDADGFAGWNLRARMRVGHHACTLDAVSHPKVVAEVQIVEPAERNPDLVFAGESTVLSLIQGRTIGTWAA
jgi:hypothetical protein